MEAQQSAGGGKTAERVSGPDLMEAVVKANAEYPGLRHFLLGGDERTLETLAARLAEKFPGFCLAGVYSPPFRYWSEKDLQDMREAIASSGANVVWVGLGCPKQERWMAEQKDLLPPAVYAGVGAAFAFHGGHGEACAGVDAEEQSGMAVPHLQGAGKAAQAVREA